MRIKKGDLVACYITNTDVYESLMNWGIVLDVNEAVEDVFVLDNNCSARWWPHRRWRVISEKDIPTLDIEKKEL